MTQHPGPFLPSRFRAVGWIAAATGLLLALLRFRYGFKPPLLEGRFFAFHSRYLESKSWTVVPNNAIEELAGLLLLAGLLMLVWTRERDEGDWLVPIRLRAFWWAASANGLLLALSLFLFFGFAFVQVLILHMFSFLAIYLLLVRCLIWSHRRVSRRSGVPGEG